MAEYLLKCGANPNQTNIVYESIIVTDLKYSRNESSAIPILKLLLNHGADMYEEDRNNAMNGPPIDFLMESSDSNDFIPVIQILIEHGFDLARCTPQSPSDFSPLHEIVDIDGNEKNAVLSTGVWFI
ncbi:hypothetical protein QAD02_009955 [Eretmocerus hayati]|uniref:Uncharacterized protein n=1 Tax=Eretmocerus hayati TaxID=131215 RepID=A0ACC2ND61_9HYME|nr:hypothetical protein QAD02_009955 [Eretmocerus hayati]